MTPAIQNAARKFPVSGSLGRGFFQRLQILAAVLLFAVAARGDEFTAAKSAYDAGKFEEAAAQYRKILADGNFSSELFFNLGNAEFKQGSVGAAVLSYRRAWTLAPRDPDIRANLGFTLERANASGPELSLPARALTRVSESEWALLAVASNWLAAALVVAWLLGFRRAGVLRAAGALALLGVLAVAGILQWRSLRALPELVIQEKTQALFGPFGEATRKFELPEGSIVREISREGEWVNVRAGGETGFVRIRKCERVSPWK